LRENGTYSGNGFVCSRLHTYGNRLPQRFTAPTTVFWNYVDNDPGCIIDRKSIIYHATCSSGRVGSAPIVVNDTAQLLHVEMRGSIDNDITHDNDGLTINASGTYVGHADISKYARSGIVINHNTVTVDSAQSRLNGGHGVDLNGVPDRDGAFGCDVTVTNVNRNEAGGFRYRGGDRNRVRVTGYLSDGATGYVTGDDGALPGANDDFSVVLNQSDSSFAKSHDDGRASFQGDGSTRRFTVNHDVLAAPRRVSVTAANGDAPVSVGVANVTADSFDVRFGSAPASGSSPAVYWNASL
jgi:hypothetical protein